MTKRIEIESNVDASGRRTVESLLRARIIAGAHYMAIVDSTNTVALDELRSGDLRDEDLPRLVLADRQNSGRGRLGRVWQSDDGTLTFSLVVSTKKSFVGGLSLAVGVGVARSLEFEFAPLKVGLKWPNDLMLGDAKLGGILCESLQESASGASNSCRVVIGIGINVDSTPSLDSADAPMAVSLSQKVGRPLQRHDVLPELVTGMLSALDQRLNEPQTIVEDFRSRCTLTGRDVRFIDRSPKSNGQSRTGRCHGIDESGHLRVSVDGELRTLNSGDVQQVRSLH